MGNWRDYQSTYVQNAVDEAYDEMNGSDDGSTDEMAEEIRTLTEAQRRLQKANYYQTIIGQPLFAGDDIPPEGLEVEAEIREFALKRLRTFLGMEAEAQEEARNKEPRFTHEEEVALKTLAAKILGRPAMLNPPPTNNPPSAAPAPVRAPPKLPPPVEPKLRQIPDVAPQAAAALKRDAPKVQKKVTRTRKQQTSGVAEKKVVEVEGRKIDGSVGLVEVDVSGPVQPPPEIERRPMPSADMMFAMEMAVAAEREKKSSGLLQKIGPTTSIGE